MRGLIPDKKHPVELRIFPNQKYGGIGHDKAEERLNYLFGRKGDTLFNRKGVYRVHTVIPVNRMKEGTIALFRYEDRILGEGKISHEVRYLEPNNPNYYPGMKGYVVFDTVSLHHYPHELSISELWKITGKFPGQRNSWTRFDLSFLSNVRNAGRLIL
jgi:hypothetical protein